MTDHRDTSGATSTGRYDAVVLGGGLAGLTLALQIKQARPSASVLVLERRPHPVPEAAHKVGESTVEISAHYFTTVLGLGEHIRTHQLRKNGLRFFWRTRRDEPLQAGLEMGYRTALPTPSYQLDRGVLENYLGEHARALGIDFADRARVTTVTLGHGREDHEVAWTCEQQAASARCRWVLDASGRRALLRHQLGLAREADHLANAAWFRVDTAVDVETFCDSPQWRERGQGDGPRYLSTNHLMGRGYWVWLIPLSSGSTSIGIVADPAVHALDTYNTFGKSMAWLEEHEPACAEAIRRALDSGAALQDFKVLKRYAHRSERVFSADRWACTGDAGMFLDPFYSPGSDFISISNTFITDLVCRSLDGRGVRVAASLYEKMYQTFFATGLTLYQDQYPLFGNPKVMPVKILWDYCYYWSISGPLFFTGSLTSLQVLARAGRDITRAVDLNRRMQQFFRDWDAVERGAVEEAFLDCARVDTAWDLNARLPDRLDPREVANRLRGNIDMLGRIAAEIVGVAQADHPRLAAPPRVRPLRRPEGHLTTAYRVLGLGTHGACDALPEAAVA
ncbi:MAG: NAD(P)/FAD-dependent oxidoreductase [Dermatophilaceae bacterium]